MTEPIKLPPLPDADWYAVWHGQALYGIYATLTEATDAASKLNVKGSVSALFIEQHLQEAQRAAIEAAKPHIIADFLERTGQWVTNKATRDKAISDAIEADRQARGEPFAWAAYDAATAELVFSDDDMSDSIAWFPLHTTPQPQQQAGEPVAWLCTPDFEGEQFLATTQGAADTLEKDGWSVQPLYDAPQPQQIPEGYKPVSPCLENLCDRIIKWRHCMSYNDSYFGEPRGELKRIAAAMERAMLEAAPTKVKP